MNELATPFFIYGCVSALLMGMGFYAMVAQPTVLSKILAWNVVGSGVFLIFGAISSRNAEGAHADPLPQAIVITGIVVSISSTAVAIALARSAKSAEQEQTDLNESGSKQQ